MRKNHYTIRYIVVLAWCLVSILPIFEAVKTSLTPFEKLGEAMILPKYFQWQNYQELFEQTDLLKYIKATFIYALGTSVISLVVSVAAAYACSRFKFKGKLPFLMTIVAIQVVPQIVIVTPMYSLSFRTGLYDTYSLVIFMMVATAIANPILLLKGFFDTINRSLEDAALVDGCTQFSALIRVVLPVSLPALATAFSLSFFSGWDAYLYPMILTSSNDKVPMAVGLSRMVDIVTPWNWIMAGTVIAIIPPIIIYLLAQRYLIGGLTAGSDK